MPIGDNEPLVIVEKEFTPVYCETTCDSVSTSSDYPGQTEGEEFVSLAETE